MSPTQRTKAYYKKQGYLCEVVEKWIAFAPGDPRRKFAPGMRQDFMGIIDCLVFTDTEVIGVQCCAGSGYSAHVKKLMEEKREKSIQWLKYPYTRLEIHAWRKLKKVKGKKATHWVPKICVIDMSDFGKAE